jgi:uncharacterized damage-inducible protein DinB
MSDILLGIEYLKEMDAEAPATRKCLERIPESLFGYKPHEKSMNLGYLALLVAEIPRWIWVTLEEGVIDFVTFRHIQPANTAELVRHFDENLEGAKRWLEKVSNEDLQGQFTLKNGGQILIQQTKKDCVSSSINHWVHHRGQLTVYMRLNDILVPSIYGPSADEKSY